MSQLNNIKKAADGASNVSPAIGYIGGVLRSVQDMIIAAKTISDFIETNPNPNLKVLDDLAKRFDKKYKR